MDTSSSDSPSPPKAQIPDTTEYAVQPGEVDSDEEDETEEQQPSPPTSSSSGNGRSSSSPNGSNNGNGSRHSDEGMPVALMPRGSGSKGFRMGEVEFITTRPPNQIKQGTAGNLKKFLTTYFPMQTKATVVMRLQLNCNDTLIFFYRDGVGEGQLNYVYQSEVRALKGVIEKAYENRSTELPKFSLIVVTKRINTRIFELRGRECVNPCPGTVVDDTITCPEKYDFYLIPQVARQGTVSPVSFNILHDESGLDADKLQRFTFKLCHLYYNWSGTVAVPAPCQYAHKLAFLTGTALHGAANEQLSNLLHFL